MCAPLGSYVGHFACYCGTQSVLHQRHFVCSTTSTQQGKDFGPDRRSCAILRWLPSSPRRSPGKKLLQMQKLLQSSWASTCLCLWTMESQLSGTLLTPHVVYFVCHSVSVYRSVWAACCVVSASCVNACQITCWNKIMYCAQARHASTSTKISEGIAQGHHCLIHHHATHHHAVRMLCCCTNYHASAMGLYCCASTGWAGLMTDLATTARHSCGLWAIKPPGKM